MNRRTLWLVVTGSAVLLAACETTNSIPYKASTPNVVQIQEIMKTTDKKIRLEDFTMSKGVESGLLCRAMGEVKVAPGKTVPQYIKEAFQEELFLAQAYANEGVSVRGNVDALKFSSVAQAFWEITITLSSGTDAGYQVQTRYEFDTSWSAYNACKNVADAFGPAVQSLIQKAVSDPGFRRLVD